ncbi:MFS general substrate transporter [Ramaria rubella]|nr:MFS general substrate transporter [Ramaria rubella]
MPSESAVHEVFDPQKRAHAERLLVRKLDMRLLPMLFLINIMNNIDRTAITAARLKGMEQDLGLSDLQYDTVIAILYASYCPTQIPSNIVRRVVSSMPSLYIGACVMLWGLTSALTGITHNYAGIMVCRVFIGIPQSAFYPGAVYLLSRWYTRKQLTFRAAILYCGLLTSSAFGSLVAAGILGNMEGKRGIRAWRWYSSLFLNGALTVCVGLMAMYILPDHPHNTRWVSSSESRLAQARLAEDAGEADNDGAGESAWSGLKMAMMDIKVPLFMIISCAQDLGLSFVNFFPTLTSTLGFSPTISLLMAAPPWVFASIVCLVTSWSCDRTGERFFHISGWMGVTMLGYIISLSTMVTGARYTSMFLMASSYGTISLLIVWVSNAVPRPPAKRAAAIALVNGFGNTGNLIGSFVWKVEWGPEYHQSMIITLCCLVLTISLAFVLRTMLKRENRVLEAQDLLVLKGAHRERVEEYARLEGISFDEAVERKKGFRYLY